MPARARPAAMLTACCSAMPTSKKRSGYALAKPVRPVPPAIAAVMATTRSSCAASAVRALPATCAALGPADWLRLRPFSTRNGATPWNFSGWRSARS